MEGDDGVEVAHQAGYERLEPPQNGHFGAVLHFFVAEGSSKRRSRTKGCAPGDASGLEGRNETAEAHRLFHTTIPHVIVRGGVERLGCFDAQHQRCGAQGKFESMSKVEAHNVGMLGLLEARGLAGCPRPCEGGAEHHRRAAILFRAVDEKVQGAREVPRPK